MKKLVLVSLLMVSAHALAVPRSPATFSDFQKAAISAQNGINGASDCSLKVSQMPQGLFLKMTSQDSKVEMFVPQNAVISVANLMPDSDGSQYQYKVKGVGALTILDASDAFFQVEITTEHGTASCEVDF